CDLRFAAEGSKFGIPAARLSIIYGADNVGQLVDLVGPAYAKDILYSARTVDDREALAMGFIQRLVPPAELEAYTYEYLRRVADNAPISVRGAKVTIESYLLGLTEERRAKLKALSLEAFESEDYKEGTRAFLEKRRPRFQGR
ncbi:MAG: enoyl-CoA hydratase, partial [Candidatus Rokubacteria bacterium]|nr:enoyl-CoA hydratase [Candidatus Rokubacteria bacterium]